MTDEQTRIFITQLHEEGCRGCIHKKYGGCPSLSKDRKYCHTKIHDAAETIRQLADELEQVKRERDAAIRDLKDADRYACDRCANYSELPEEKCDESGSDCLSCKMDCPCRTCMDNSNWAWRGERK